jgi:hypothetical protein
LQGSAVGPACGSRDPLSDLRCQLFQGHDAAHGARFGAGLISWAAPQPGTPVAEAARPERPSWLFRLCACGHLGQEHQTPGCECAALVGDRYCPCNTFRDAPSVVDVPACARCGRVGHVAGNACAHNCVTCGAAPGVACDPAKHDARREYQCGVRGCTNDPTPGHANCDAHAEYDARESACGRPCRLGCPDDDRCDGMPGDPPVGCGSLSADLAAWNRHQRGCAACTSAPTAASLCLAGAALWQRAGLEVIPVPARPAPVPPPIPGMGNLIGFGDRKHPRHLRTSELLRLVAAELDAAGMSSPTTDELHKRARYLATLGGHDDPPQIDDVTGLVPA